MPQICNRNQRKTKKIYSLVYKKRSHIALFMFMVYFLSFTLHAMPAMMLGEVQIKKECPNKKKLRSSEIKSFDQLPDQFKKSTDNQQQENETPAEVSICSTSSAFILNDYRISFSPTIVKGPNIIFFSSHYQSLVLENTHQPPQLA